MPIARRVIAFVILLGWLFAAGHVALEHGGVADGGVHQHSVASGAGDDDHDDHAPAPDGDRHHHDFSVMDGGQWMKTTGHQTPAPVWLPLCDALAERLADLLRQGREMRVLPTFEHAPPDERASGWLLVCRTAHQVRGPSLAV